WTFCVSGGGWNLWAQDEGHTFFGRTETTKYTCENSPSGARGRPLGYPWSVSCSTDGANERGTARIAQRVRWSLRRGPSVTEMLIRKSTVFTGRIRGTASYDFGFDRRAAPPLVISA